MSSEEVCEFVWNYLTDNFDLEGCVHSLIQTAIEKGSGDNISAVLICFDDWKGTRYINGKVFDIDIANARTKNLLAMSSGNIVDELTVTRKDDEAPVSDTSLNALFSNSSPIDATAVAPTSPLNANDSSTTVTASSPPLSNNKDELENKLVDEKDALKAEEVVVILDPSTSPLSSDENNSNSSDVPLPEVMSSPSSGSSAVPLCCMDCGVVSSLVCDMCVESFCAACFGTMHAKGVFRSHSSKPIGGGEDR